MIFFKGLTELNHSYVDHNGMLIGESISVDIILDRAPVSPTEEASLKLDIEQCIKAANGLNNKVWIIDGYSNCKVTRTARGYVLLSTPQFDAEIPTKYVSELAGKDYNNEVICLAIKNHLKGCSLDVKCSVAVAPRLSSPMNSVYSCIDSDIFNGSINFIEAYKMVNSEDEVGTIQTLLNEITRFMDRAIIVSPNRVKDRQSKAFKIEFENYWILFKGGHKIYETDLNVQEFLYHTFKDRIDALAIDMFFVSRGLANGIVKS